MSPIIRGRLWPGRQWLVSAALVLAGLPGCKGGEVTPPPPLPPAVATLAVPVRFDDPIAGVRLAFDVWYLRQDGARVPVLTQTEAPAASGAQTYSLTAPLGACLADSQRESSPQGACQVRVSVTYIGPSGARTDSASVGPVTVRRGTTTASSDFPLTVFRRVQRVSVLDPAPPLAGGGIPSGTSVPLSATAFGSNNETVPGRRFRWRSSDTVRVTISSSGVLEAREPGQATVTVFADEDTTITASVPVVISGGGKFAAVSIGFGVSCALDAAGDAYCWGSSPSVKDFVLGLTGAVLENTWAPRRIRGAVSFTAIGAGANFACGVATNRAVYCWGSGAFGVIGDGTLTPQPAPTAVSLSGVSFADVAVGGFTACARSVDGVAYCWGRNSFATVGDGTTIDRAVPTPVSGGLRFAELTAGAQHFCGRTSDGSVYCWGSNAFGALGDGTTTSRPEPVRVSGLPAVVRVAAGANHTCALTASGATWCWGWNNTGQLGDGTTVDSRSVPAPVTGGLNFATISGSCGSTAAGEAWCWGDNAAGGLGAGSSASLSNIPVRVAGTFTFTRLFGRGGSACGVTPANDVYCWGFNRGSLGDGTFDDRFVPVAIALGRQ